MGNRNDRITLTFSKRNKDVRKILDNKIADDINFVSTDYICEAIRFYEKNKDRIYSNNIDEDTIKKLIDKALESRGEFSATNTAEDSSVSNESCAKTIDITNAINDLDDFEDGWDEED